VDAPRWKDREEYKFEFDPDRDLHLGDEVFLLAYSVRLRP
jgi:hypothetical protein